MKLFMFSNHVSDLSSAYWHDELTPPQSRRVAEHLIGCSRCRAEFENVKLGARFAEQLEVVTAPESLWAGIAAGINVEAVPSRRFHFLRFKFLKPLAIAAVLIVLVGGGLLLLLPRRVDNQSGWQVARLGGSPRIGSQSVTDKSRLGVGQWLETDGDSRAKLEVANIGNVEVDPNTRVRLLQTNNSEHRLELARGRLSARISAPPKLFFVNTPSGVAEDLGCAYTLEVDDAGNSLLHVTAGWVSMQLNGRESAVPAGAACATRKGFGPGTPYFEDATENFRISLTKVDFESNDTAGLKEPALQTVLAEARRRDAISLWYLMSRIGAANRVTVYGRLAALVPPPAGTTREGLLALNRQMLDDWRVEIDRDRGVTNGRSFHSTLRRIWTSTLGRVHGWEGKR